MAFTYNSNGMARGTSLEKMRIDMKLGNIRCCTRNKQMLIQAGELCIVAGIISSTDQLSQRAPTLIMVLTDDFVL